ncbi:MAG TPA: type IV pilus twitching motility protein PilT [Fimbriimonadaceae bacterium]|nr:type IV pilus twitching motility protein PilT [Fimbriimonadaceae bacterium]
MQPIDTLLKRCVDMSGSDLHFKSDTGKAYVRVHGDLRELDDIPTFDHEDFKKELYSILRPEQVSRFAEALELDFAYEITGVARFRGNLYQQRSHVQAAFRVIPYAIQTMEDLQLPPACYDFIDKPRGLVLVTGPAGSGKSTSLAAMIDRINSTQAQHIVTVEDPLEFIHDDKESHINQRELDVDTLTFSNALKYVLRQDPDVILVGEMRDLETIHLAITAAETGHLVFATLHTVDAVQTVDRIVDVFPMHQQQQVRMQLSVNLVGVLSQTLIRRKDGRGRIAAFEVLVATSAVRNLIRENKTYQISSLIQTGSRAKMQTLDQSLATLVEKGLVSPEEAKSRAKDPWEFDRMLALDKQAADAAAAAAAANAPKFTGSHAQTSHQPGTGPDPLAEQPAAPPAGPVRGQPNRPGYRRE